VVAGFAGVNPPVAAGLGAEEVLLGVGAGPARLAEGEVGVAALVWVGAGPFAGVVAAPLAGEGVDPLPGANLPE